MNSVLITGCNRGIGLGLISHILKQPDAPKHIIATCRSKEKANQLVTLSEQNSNLHILEVDVTNFDKYDLVVKDVENIIGSEGLDLLVNNAGVASKFTRIQLTKPEQMIDNFTVNTVAPVLLTKSFLPLLKQASSNHRAVVVNVSSILGSIQCNTDGGYYPYRASKAALNACTKSMSIDLATDKIIAVALHPGWVKTDMGGKSAPLEVEHAVSAIWNTIKSLKNEDTGKFLQYDGKKLDW